MKKMTAKEKLRRAQSATQHYRTVLHEIANFSCRSKAAKMAREGLGYYYGELTDLEVELLNCCSELLKALGYNTYAQFAAAQSSAVGEGEKNG